MAKANQAFRHPMDKVFGIAKIKLIPLQKLKLIELRIKRRKRINKHKLNRAKHKSPRGFKLAKKDRFDVTKRSKQIQNGFKVAKEWK